MGEGLPHAPTRARSDCFVSMPAFFEADPEQAALALDGLAGFRVVARGHQRLRRSAADGVASLVKEGRTHVLPSDLGDDQLAAQVARIALIEEEARLDRRLAKISKRRRLVNRRLAA